MSRETKSDMDIWQHKRFNLWADMEVNIGEENQRLAKASTDLQGEVRDQNRTKLARLKPAKFGAADHEDFDDWWGTWLSTVHNNVTLEDGQSNSYLRIYTYGPVFDLIKNLPNCGTSYLPAVKMIKEKFQKSPFDTVLNALKKLVKLPALSYGETASDNSDLVGFLRGLDAVMVKEATNSQGVMDPYLLPFMLGRSKISPVLHMKFENEEELLLRDQRPNKYSIAFKKLIFYLDKHESNLKHDERRDISGFPGGKRKKPMEATAVKEKKAKPDTSTANFMMMDNTDEEDENSALEMAADEESRTDQIVAQVASKVATAMMTQVQATQGNPFISTGHNRGGRRPNHRQKTVKPPPRRRATSVTRTDIFRPGARSLFTRTSFEISIAPPTLVTTA